MLKIIKQINIYYIDSKENVNNEKENQEKTKKSIHFVSAKETPKVLLKKEIYKIIKNKMHISGKIKKMLNKASFWKNDIIEKVKKELMDKDFAKHKKLDVENFMFLKKKKGRKK